MGAPAKGVPLYLCSCCEHLFMSSSLLLAKLLGCDIGVNSAYTSRQRPEKATTTLDLILPLPQSEPVPQSSISLCPLSGAREWGLHLCGCSIQWNHRPGITAKRSSRHIPGLCSSVPLTVLGKGVFSELSIPLEEEVPKAGIFSSSRWGLSQKLDLASMGGSVISLILTWSQCPLLSWAFPPIPAPGEPHLMLWEAKAPVLSASRGAVSLGAGQ